MTFDDELRALYKATARAERPGRYVVAYLVTPEFYRAALESCGGEDSQRVTELKFFGIPLVPSARVTRTMLCFNMEES